LGSLDDAVDILALRDSFDCGLVWFSTHDVNELGRREMGFELRVNDNQFVSICTTVIDWIQNISELQDEKADGCDAGGK
jgi:hypothetical protein